ncbi:MAG: 3-oxoacyl-ACP synthase [Bacteroidetes bacterium MedPE-SWsnd-G2]|nr:MAG: 3-oxoacyl-ACP synthase [Bacteroidetes bacterium MedPE-SWsnd-G2]
MEKQLLLNACQSFIQGRLDVLKNLLSDIEHSLTSETKSSAGDKHETGRAMLQLEREKAGNQLAQLQKEALVLQKIDLSQSSGNVRLGSFVRTSKLNYFIAISAGEITINGEQAYAISPNTPIGKLLLSKSVNDLVEFRNQKFKIIEVL